MNEIAFLQNYLFIGAALFGLGLIGFLVRRNIIVMFLCAEMMLQGVSTSMVAWGRFHNNWAGQSMVIFIIAVAACEAGIALALILVVCKRSGNLDIASWQLLREEGQDAYQDREVPEVPYSREVWPKLTPAGVRPDHDPEEQMYRTNV